MANTGYSNTPLAKKLGIKKGFVIRLINQPDYYFDLFDVFPEEVEIVDELEMPKDFIHLFIKQASELKAIISELGEELKPNGMIWVSWPKKSSKVTTDITEDIIRNLALGNGLVDIKVCAVDEIWSGLKLVIPVKNRKSS
jgi:hypothetical protein